jgi:hypothetical protein
MRTKILAATLVLLAVMPSAAGGGKSVPIRIDDPPPIPTCARSLMNAQAHDHASKRHPKAVCKMKRISELEVSKAAGLGQIEVRGKIAAVLQRDEGAVALLDVKNPRKPKVLGRYDDDIADSFDGDLVFSKNGKWLFYARQTHQFSRDGIHVLDVSNPKEPTLAFYQPQGGAFRIGYLNRGGNEYVITMDAIAGLTINRFEPTTGALIPVYVDALPALKVGGPASAGVFVDPKDPKLGLPLLYATNGMSGLDIYDLSVPEAPTKLGSWDQAGLADVEVRTVKGKRQVFAASEYWFDENTHPGVYVLDATNAGDIKQRDLWTAPVQPTTEWRVNGLELTGKRLSVAFSHAGLVSLDATGEPKAVYQQPRPVNEEASLKASPYAMDVESARGLLYLTDASTGILTILKAR